jgi:hypothetical protein
MRVGLWRLRRRPIVIPWPACIIAGVIERLPRAHPRLTHARCSSRKRTKNVRNVSPRTQAARRTRRILPSCGSVILILLRRQIRRLALARRLARSDRVRASWRRSARPIITAGCARRASTTTRGKTGTSWLRDPTCTGLRATANR